MKHLILLLIAFSFLQLKAQTPVDTFWHLKSFNKKGFAAINYYEALEFVKSQNPTEVIVAVIDAGVDVYHPDLQDRLWFNPNEITNNGIDDDGNGYIDDLYGWNFIGDVTFDNLEITRQYVKLNKEFELQNKIGVEAAAYETLKDIVLSERREAKFIFEILQQAKFGFEFLEDEYSKNITRDILEKHKSNNVYEERARLVLLNSAPKKSTFDYIKTRDETLEAFNQYDYLYNYAYNPKFDSRKEKVGDDYTNVEERIYGNNKVYYGKRFSEHGTHVAGIIAANSSNNYGAKGICQNCKIMSIRAVPEGDERDKDVANSIYYAVDNGAMVINMSFGKAYVNNLAAVEKAIAYAQTKNVLIVHGSGNDGKNNDENINYPNDFGGKYGANWIEVGASSWQSKPKAIAEFSNYGKKEVDVFAPGVAIYSTLPEETYEALDGTSMASPVVAGAAAFLWSYFPSLTAKEIKNIITSTASPLKGRHRKPGSIRKTRLKRVSKSGGIINLYEAAKRADEITKGRDSK